MILILRMKLLLLVDKFMNIYVVFLSIGWTAGGGGRVVG